MTKRNTTIFLASSFLVFACIAGTAHARGASTLGGDKDGGEVMLGGDKDGGEVMLGGDKDGGAVMLGGDKDGGA